MAKILMMDLMCVSGLFKSCRRFTVLRQVSQRDALGLEMGSFLEWRSSRGSRLRRYKKEFVLLKSRMFYDSARGIGPTFLLVDFCAPRLSHQPSI